MENPWLDIPLADYEGHMACREVRQLDALAELFAEAVEFSQPASVAVLGVAGGNGLDRIDGARTKRVVGVDINPRYLDAVRRRHPDLAGLELHCVDLAEDILHLEPVELVHAALVFEHAGLDHCLENALSLVATDGVMSVVLQLPGEPDSDIGQGGYASIQRLASHFALIDSTMVRKRMEESGLRLVEERKCGHPAGKGFWMGIFTAKG